MSRDRIIRLRHKNGVPTSEDSGFPCYEHQTMFHMDGLSVYYSAYPAGDTGGSTIVDSHQLTITLSDLGHLDYTTDGESNGQGHAYPEDTFLWLANRPVYSCWENPLECLTFALEPTFLARAAYESIDPDRIELLGQAHLRDPLIYGIGMTMWENAQNGGIDRLYGEALANAIAIHTLRNYATIKPVFRQWSDHLTRSELRHAIKFIHDNLDTDLSLQDIAAAAGLSVHYFSRLFKQTTGMAPHRYVIEQRVERAKPLLRYSLERSVAEIAVEVGFYDQSHFMRHFKAVVGVNPGAYRAKG